MSKAVFEAFADRMAKQYEYFKTAFDAVSDSDVGTPYYDLITAADLKDVELNMLYASDIADKWFFNSGSLIATIRSFTNFTSLVGSFESALWADGTLTDKTFDGYCTSVGTKVSDYTNQVYYAANGYYMLAKNVWCEDIKTLATAEMTGVETLAYTAGATLYSGTYSAIQKADGTHYGVSRLKAVISGTNTITSLVVNVSGRKADGTLQTVGVTISGAPGVEINIGTTEVFLDVTDIDWVSGGTNGDKFTILNTKDRTIAL